MLFVLDVYIEAMHRLICPEGRVLLIKGSPTNQQ